MNKLDNLCPICTKEPNSHSFRKIAEHNFYTCPAQASKYNDTQGILNHYRLHLEKHGPNPWIWIFDCKGFELKHMLELQTAYGIVSLLNEKYGTHLKKIIVINQTWHIHSILTIIMPFLNKEIQSLIEILS
jgi:hypothetical protein